MPRHKLPPLSEAGALPEWVKRESNDCLRSIAEEVYTARGLAVQYHATSYPSCLELFKAAEKVLAVMNDESLPDSKRCEAGERALRKFWEAKACARRYASRHGKYPRA